MMEDTYYPEVVRASADVLLVTAVAPSTADEIKAVAEPVAGAGRTSVAKSLDRSVEAEALATPSNEHLRRLAAANPPPPQWLEGEEEPLF